MHKDIIQQLTSLGAVRETLRVNSRKEEQRKNVSKEELGRLGRLEEFLDNKEELYMYGKSNSKQVRDTMVSRTSTLLIDRLIGYAGINSTYEEDIERGFINSRVLPYLRGLEDKEDFLEILKQTEPAIKDLEKEMPDYLKNWKKYSEEIDWFQEPIRRSSFS